jgi:hypothetical protein
MVIKYLLVSDHSEQEMHQTNVYLYRLPEYEAEVTTKRWHETVIGHMA